LNVDAYLGDFRWKVEDDAEPNQNQISFAVRDYLGDMREQLLARSRAGASGREINEANSDCVDRLIRKLFQMAEAEYYVGASKFRKDMAVIAVGGYGRRTLAIHSDIDLLFLHRGEIDNYIQKLAERLQMWLWDGNLVVGCALRTIEQTIEIARTDMTVRTGILDVRFLAGDVDLFHEFVESVRRVFRANDQEFIQALQDTMQTRHEKYGESLYRLQPNLKEGAGGLRDYHIAEWVALTRHSSLSLRGLIDFLHFGLLSEPELDEFRAALDFLWGLRNTMHFLSGRKNDQLNFDLQERVAKELGYEENLDVSHLLAVEQFMRDYYRHGRVIQNCSMVIIDQCLPRSGVNVRKELEEGFLLSDRGVEIIHAALLRKNPMRIMLAFEIAAREDAPLSVQAIRLLRANLDLMDALPADSGEAGECFLRILESKQRVMLTLLEMNGVGVLGRLFQEWEHIVCLWQHVTFHTYTVDVHSIYLVGELERLLRGAYSQDWAEFTELIHRVEDVTVLLLGCLCHDIGKGLGGEHADRGAEIARTICERLGLAEERIARVCFLVREHLHMTHVAQRRDLSDPKVISAFAQLVGDYTNLRNLYLLSFADFRASSGRSWTRWTAGLMRDLFHRTGEILESGELDPAAAEAKLQARAERLRDSVFAQLLGMGIEERLIEKFCSNMSRRYFLSHTSWQIARQALIVIGFRPDAVINCSIREMRGDFTEFIICAEDAHGLYSNIAGCLTLNRINILGSHIHTTRDGLALEVYRVATPKGGPDEKRRLWERVQRLIVEVISGEKDLSVLMLEHGRTGMPGRVVAPRREQALVRITNQESDFYTIVDVSAYDRLGLLYGLTHRIAELDLEIHLSKASTRLDQVADTFYLKTRSGEKVTDPELLQRLYDALLEVASGSISNGA